MTGVKSSPDLEDLEWAPGGRMQAATSGPTVLNGVV